MRLSPGRSVRIFFTTFVCTACFDCVVGENRVAVASFAPFTYEGGRTKDGKLLPQTYVFLQGKFSTSGTKDVGLEQVSFRQIAAQLAGGLKKQEFYPAKDLGSADLVLVTHWGATNPRRHHNELPSDARDLPRAQYAEPQGTSNGASFSTDAVNNAGISNDFGLGELASTFIRPELDLATRQGWEKFQQDAASAQAEIDSGNTANLIGIGGDLAAENARPYDSEYARTLRSMLDEERYYIVIVAYDAKSMLKHKTLKRLWTAKLSIRSPGVNFATALERMSVAGGQYFGTMQSGLRVERPKVRSGDVEIGEMIVIEKLDK